MRKILLVLFVLLVVFVALSAWLVAKIGWVAVPVMFVAGIVALVGIAIFVKRNAGRLVEGALKQPFKLKGAVLRGADARVHSVLPVPADSVPPREPDPDEDTEDSPRSRAPRRHYLVDATISPAANGAQTPFGAWEPGELSLAAPGADPDEIDDGEDVDVARVEIEDAGQFVAWDGEKYVGPRRLRILVSVPETMREARFRYYFELFGNVSFPNG